jgi:TonB family protein
VFQAALFAEWKTAVLFAALLAVHALGIAGAAQAFSRTVRAGVKKDDFYLAFELVNANNNRREGRTEAAVAKTAVREDAAMLQEAPAEIKPAEDFSPRPLPASAAPEQGAAVDDSPADGESGEADGAAREGAGGPVGASDTDYLALILAHLERRKVYPYAARKRGAEGDIAVSFVINGDGKAGNITVHGENRYLVLAAEQSVRQASPFPPPTNTVFQASLVISYRLEESEGSNEER